MLSFAPRFNFGFSSNPSDDTPANATGGEDSAKRSDLVGQILALNPTASTVFLAQFQSEQLAEYLAGFEGAEAGAGH